MEAVVYRTSIIRESQAGKYVLDTLHVFTDGTGMLYKICIVEVSWIYRTTLEYTNIVRYTRNMYRGASIGVIKGLS